MVEGLTGTEKDIEKVLNKTENQMVKLGVSVNSKGSDGRIALIAAIRKSVV